MGNLFTTAGQKRVFVAGGTHNYIVRVHIMFIHVIFFPSGGLAGRMWPAGRRLPTPVLENRDDTHGDGDHTHFFLLLLYCW